MTRSRWCMVDRSIRSSTKYSLSFLFEEFIFLAPLLNRFFFFFFFFVGWLLPIRCFRLGCWNESNVSKVKSSQKGVGQKEKEKIIYKPMGTKSWRRSQTDRRLLLMCCLTSLDDINIENIEKIWSRHDDFLFVPFLFSIWFILEICVFFFNRTRHVGVERFYVTQMTVRDIIQHHLCNMLVSVVLLLLLSAGRLAADPLSTTSSTVATSSTLSPSASSSSSSSSTFSFNHKVVY